MDRGRPDGSPESQRGEDEPFWRRKTLAEMNREEWESVCDGCGRCCVLKLADEDAGKTYPTSIVCRLFDHETCRCTRYAARHRLVPDCVRLDARTVHEYDWLPDSCAYRRLARGRDLAWWHPLVSGSAQTVIDAGISVYGNVVSERAVHPDEPLEDHIVRWVDEP